MIKEISAEYSLKGLMLKLKLQYFGHLMQRTYSLENNLMLGKKDWRQGEKGMTEDKMVGWYHRFNGHEFEQALGVGDGQGSLACCSPWGRKESNTTERLNWTELNWEGIWIRILIAPLFAIRKKCKNLALGSYIQWKNNAVIKKNVFRATPVFSVESPWYRLD